MAFIALIAALIAVVWGAIYAQRGSLVVGCGLMLVIGYVFGHEFWNTDVGPIPVTIDRVLVLGLIAAFAVQWRIGRLAIRPLTAGDWMLAAALAVLVASAFLSGQPEFMTGLTSKWGRLAISFVLPAVLFFIVRQVPITRRELTWLLSAVVALGVYLAVTAVLEVAGVWSLVFPRYISDPGLGIHYGRARGPELNSVSLGIYLTAALWCAWTLMRQATGRWQQLALAATLPLMTLGIFLTYTRSTWIGLAATGLIVAAFEIPRRWRFAALATATLCGLVVAAASWSHVVALEREGTGAESGHSVDQRTSFAYVSWQMWRDNPVFGVGFGRFFDRKLPYLSDRSQNFELESIRSLHHHNTLLSILTETGLVGLASCIGVFVVWTRIGWSLAKSAAADRWVRAQGVLLVLLVVNYLSSALFHDLTLLPSQQLLLFVFAGLAINLRQETLGWQPLTFGWHALRLREGRGSATPPTPVGDSWRATHVRLFGMDIACVTMHETVERILGWCREPLGETCRYVVTPNVDHAVMFQHRPELRAAYGDASLVLADGAPIVLASRLLGRPLPERVAGSDLVPQLFASTREPLRVFLLGAAPGVAELAATRITRLWRRVKIVGTYSPPLGFENNVAENARIFNAIASAVPDVIVVGLGAPKQELWVHRHRHELQAKVVLCAGATIDFLAGHRRRSPVWMQRAGLEWLHRVCSEPRRLASRYARDAWVFPQLLWREWRRVNA